MTHVLIAGAGVGGLCLAHGLRKAGIEVSVFERDADVAIRNQGYRIHIDADGGEALRSCLPEHLFRLYLATSAVPGAGRISTLRSGFRELASHDVGGGSAHSAVNRLTLRQILLAGLGDDVRFGQAVIGAEQSEDGVVVRFEDGSACHGDVLVGADGVNSVLRPVVTPDAEVIDTGSRCVYGRTPLADLPGLPSRLFEGFTAVAGRKSVLALAAFRSRTPIADAVAEFAPGVTLDPVQDYLMWAVVGAVPDVYQPVALHGFARKSVRFWHKEFRRIVGNADVPATFRTPIRTSVPVPEWKTGRITLLGDAIHVMPPAGGVGANTALRDAALLAEVLASAGPDPRPALAEYEEQMRDYATAVVRESTKAAGMYRQTSRGTP